MSAVLKSLNHLLQHIEALGRGAEVRWVKEVDCFAVTLHPSHFAAVEAARVKESPIPLKYVTLDGNDRCFFFKGHLIREGVHVDSIFK